VPRMQVHLPSNEKKLQFEAQLMLNGARAQSIISSFSGKQKQPENFPLEWKGDWQLSGAWEIPVDQPENFRWNGDLALDGDFVYASGETKIALQKPAFAVRVSGQVVSISDFQAGLWDGRIEVPGMHVHLPSAEKQLRFETQLILSGARSQSISDSFNAGRKQPDAVPLDWKGAWRINAEGEIPVNQPGDFRWNGDAALDGEFVYASSAIDIALQKPAFSVRMEKQVVSISNLKAGLWEGTVEAPKTLLYLPAAKEKLRFETQLTFNGARPLSVRKSFALNRKQPASVPLNWKSAWRLKAAGEVPLDQPELFQWSGDAALDGDVYYANGETKIAVPRAWATRPNLPQPQMDFL